MPSVHHSRSRFGLGRVVAALVVAAAAAYLLCWHTAASRTAAELERLRKQGEPLTLAELVPRIPAGQQNAADLYLKAFEIGERTGFHTLVVDLAHLDWTPQDAASAQAAVAARGDYYDLLDRAVAQDVCAFPRDDTDPFPDEPDYRPGMRDAARALLVRAELRLRAGDLDGALASSAAGLRLADHTEQQPDTISYLTASAIRPLAFESVQNVLCQGDPSPAACRRLYDRLGRFDAYAALARTMRGERAWGLLVFRSAEQGRPLHTMMSGGPQADWELDAYQLIGRPLFYADEGRYLKLMDAAIAAAGTRRSGGKSHAESDSDSDPLGGIGGQFAIITQALDPLAWSNLFWQRDRSAALVGAARIGLALTVYHRDHGAYPASLAELARAGWKLPLDPFTQQPYHYRREDGGFDVWSVGPDLADNHATNFVPGKFRGEQPGYDYVFRVTR